MENNSKETKPVSPKEAAEKYASVSFDSSYLNIDDHFLAGFGYRDKEVATLTQQCAAKDRQIEELKAGMEEIQNLYKGNYEMPAAKALKKAQIIAFQTLHNINSKP